MRILVCGGRNYDDRERVHEILDEITNEDEETVIIHGGANGADLFAAQWAKENNVTVLPFHADWDDLTTPPIFVKINKHGKQYNALAGFVRNQRMVDEGRPDLVLAFPGGKGTADMIERAEKAGIKVDRIPA